MITNVEQNDSNLKSEVSDYLTELRRIFDFNYLVSQNHLPSRETNRQKSTLLDRF
ncbi:MAG: hypothetical protein KTR22_14395 [Flavobacteriaceae bacterium]|nr:hypothetical protein [Flavobacteriaceae bacterium]